MELKHHISVSLIISTFLFVIFKSWIIFISSFTSGILIDSDHILDYLMEFRRRIRIREFFETYRYRKLSYAWVIFHSWELLFLLGICAILMNWNPWFVGIFIGFAQHLILDQLSNKPNKYGYFFLWRLKNAFDLKAFLD
ncbi:MAG: hypothetical protein ACYSTS_05045 [Planctomycetota bacterium]|jgi:hypothetical protein